MLKNYRTWIICHPEIQPWCWAVIQTGWNCHYMPYSILLPIRKTAKLSTSKKDFSDNLLSQTCSRSTYLGTCQISRIPYILRLLASHHPAVLLLLSPRLHFIFTVPDPLNGSGALQPVCHAAHPQWQGKFASFRIDVA